MPCPAVAAGGGGVLERFPDDAGRTRGHAVAWRDRPGVCGQEEARLQRALPAVHLRVHDVCRARHAGLPFQLSALEARAPTVRAGSYSPSVSRLALPPAAVVLMVTTFSVAKRGR